MEPNKDSSVIIRKNISEQVYDFVKYKILAQEYKPGQRLHINELKEKLKVSSTPIKDALNKLVGEGLVEFRSRRGVFVTKPSKSEMRESFELRLMMETYAIECALRRKIRRKEIEVLEKILDESAKNIKNDEYEQFMEKDREFHYALVKMARNRKLCEFCGQLNIHMQIARNYYIRNYKRQWGAHKEHEKILNALKKQDAHLTKKYLTGHITAVKRSVMRKEDPLLKT